MAWKSGKFYIFSAPFPTNPHTLAIKLFSEGPNKLMKNSFSKNNFLAKMCGKKDIEKPVFFFLDIFLGAIIFFQLSQICTLSILKIAKGFNYRIIRNKIVCIRRVPAPTGISVHWYRGFLSAALIF